MVMTGCRVLALSCRRRPGMKNVDFSTFTKKDRDVVRLEFMDRFGSAASIHEGFWLRRWVTGPHKGQPKVPAAVGSMLERGLVTIVDNGNWLPRVCFTDAGLLALLAMADDPRAFQPPER